MPVPLRPWDLVPCPKNDSINTGLSAAHPSLMLATFGRPGALSEDCSPVTNAKLRKLFKAVKVGQIALYGLGPVVDVFVSALTEFKAAHPDSFASMKSAGMTCCRHVRGVPDSYSNHSWGTALDVYFGDRNDVVGDGMCQSGLLQFYTVAHRHGLYWGCGFSKVSPDREDSMHSEASSQLISKLFPHPI